MATPRARGRRLRRHQPDRPGRTAFSAGAAAGRPACRAGAAARIAWRRVPPRSGSACRLLCRPGVCRRHRRLRIRRRDRRRGPSRSGLGQRALARRRGRPRPRRRRPPPGRPHPGRRTASGLRRRPRPGSAGHRRSRPRRRPGAGGRRNLGDGGDQPSRRRPTRHHVARRRHHRHRRQRARARPAVAGLARSGSLGRTRPPARLAHPTPPDARARRRAVVRRNGAGRHLRRFAHAVRPRRRRPTGLVGRASDAARCRLGDRRRPRRHKPAGPRHRNRRRHRAPNRTDRHRPRHRPDRTRRGSARGHSDRPGLRAAAGGLASDLRHAAAAGRRSRPVWRRHPPTSTGSAA